MSHELKQRAREAIERLAALDSAKKPGGGIHGQVVGCEPWVIRTNGDGLQCLHDARVLLEELLDPFGRRATVPAAQQAGWVSVPVVLRQEMDEAMDRAMKLGSNQHLWDAALSATPSAPAEAASVRDAVDAARWRYSMEFQDLPSGTPQPEAITAMWRKVYTEHRSKPTRAEYEGAMDAAIRALQGKPEVANEATVKTEYRECCRHPDCPTCRGHGGYYRLLESMPIGDAP